MKSRRWLVISFVALACLCMASQAVAQSPSVLYTFDNTGNAVPNIENWIRGFGAGGTSATLDNNIAGTLTITETSGGPNAGLTQAFSDGFNRVRESSIPASGGLDLTGLDFLEWDLGHNGALPVNVQFFVQAGTASTFVSLGPDLAVTPGLSTYQVPLSGLTPAQAVYVRTMGINIRDHSAQGNLSWSVNELRSGGTPLQARDLVTHNVGTAEGGLQGAIVNFDGASVQGNTGQNQTGLSHDPSGPGSLEWTDVAGGAGAAISWGNGTAWNGNTFNNRVTDLSNYDYMIVRMSAADPADGGGVLGLNAFMQRNNFAFQSVESGAGRNVPIDGRFHTVKWSLAGMTLTDVVDQTGINLFSHPQDLVINVDYVRFVQVPEPATLSLLAVAMVGCLSMIRRTSRGR
jgi:hypothetical protein